MTKKAPAIVVPGNPLKPLFMWTGGKGKVIPKYKELGVLPSYKQFDSYVEPFFGGGAVFCDVVNSGFDKEFVINDLNTEMMYVYYWIREAPTEFILECNRLLRARYRLDEPGRKLWYYSQRTKYWNMPDLRLYPNQNQVPATLKTAATLYVLMLTGFNGFWQVKKTGIHKGKFGAAVGFVDNKRTIKAVNHTLIHDWSKALARAHLFNGSYKDIKIPTGNSFIFVDPPYRGSIMTYGISFKNKAQKELVNWCIEKSLQNHTLLFANRELIKPFFRKLFRKNEDEYRVFLHHYVKGTKGYELIVVLEPERLKRGEIMINGEVVTFSVKLLTKMSKKNPIIKEFGITLRGLFESARSQK